MIAHIQRQRVAVTQAKVVAILSMLVSYFVSVSSRLQDFGFSAFSSHRQL